MQPTCLPLSAALLAGVALPASAVPDSFIKVDVAVKVIVDPATGQTPATMDDAMLRESFELMNRWLANTWRGYRVRLVDLDASQNFRRIGGLNDSTGPGQWYAIDLKTYDTTANHDFEVAAKANKSLYAWNDYAINIYFNNNDYSRAGFPSENSDLVISSYRLLTDDHPPGQILTQSYQVTRFVDWSVASSGTGTSSSPLKALATAITIANPGGNDILLLRPGTYTAATISKPLTIRATRYGVAQIQKP
ncbi:MAG: hypothetical protein NTW21_34720 [Verrucomicrobia bacterium]|nr:hypothetical protein [Verrucomicrobiota bacterium]